MVLSGNFGEIRPDHFHSGIDIKTQGTIGHHVFSIENGYVSRIKVQANGYGKSIYITHPNGYTSVYGHLDRYREDIATYVKNMQYKRHTHALDIYLNQNQFPLQKGDFIAYSGNSGGSSGPHLHFEIRNALNQHPTNVLTYGFDIADRVAPRFHSVVIQPTGSRGVINGETDAFTSNVVSENGRYTLPHGRTVRASGNLRIGVEVFDYLDGASNRCGVYTLELFVDHMLLYSHTMDEFSFSETRYVNASMDYGYWNQTGIKAHRLYRLPNDRLRLYKKASVNQAFEVSEKREYDVRIVATDVAGNQSELNFSIMGEPTYAPVRSPSEGFVKHMNHKEENKYANGEVSLIIPAKALYEDLEFTFGKSTGKVDLMTPFYHIATSDVPLHRPFTLSIKAPPIDPTMQEKLLLVSQNDEGEIESAGGEYQHGAVVATPRSFGDFAIALDTIAPVIVPLNGAGNRNLTGKKSLKFFIKDHLSGIEKYEGYIDNSWALFEYDPKNDLLTCTFDEKRITRGTEHELELYVADASGNVNLYHSTFIW